MVYGLLDIVFKIIYRMSIHSFLNMAVEGGLDAITNWLEDFRSTTPAVFEKIYRFINIFIKN